MKKEISAQEREDMLTKKMLKDLKARAKAVRRTREILG